MAIVTALHEGAYRHTNQDRFEAWANRWKAHTGKLPALPKTRFVRCHWCGDEIVVPYHADPNGRYLCSEYCESELQEHYR